MTKHQQVKNKKKGQFHNKIGKAPGTMTYMGTRAGLTSYLSILDYDQDEFVQTDHTSLEQVSDKPGQDKTRWMNVSGLSDVEFVGKIGKRFNLNPLVLEDIVNTHQRPKVVEYENYVFTVFKMIYLNSNQSLTWEHLALVLVDNQVIVFQEVEQDVFHTVRQRINSKSGRIRTKGADYLFFALIDAIIDHYYIVMEHIEERIDHLESEIYENPNNDTLQEIQRLKKQVLKVRQWVSPVRELVNRLISTENPLISEDTKHFLRDVLDHSLEINETIQVHREMTMNLMEMYMSNVSNKMNEVMKVLTIMASIFIPLTFIAGVYGMNFTNMPELQFQYGYFVVLGIMLLVFVVMIIFFRKRGWI